MFDKIEEKANTAMTTQASTTNNDGSPAAPPPPAEPTALEVANARIAALEAERTTERAEHEAALTEQRLKIAVAVARKPIQKVGTIQQDIAIDRVRRAVGGNCFYANLTPAEKLASLGVTGTEAVKDTTVKAYFGPTSDGAAANALYRSNPEEYARLRLIAKARNIIG